MAAGAGERFANSFKTLNPFGKGGDKDPSKPGILSGIGGFFSDMMDKGAEMISGRNAEGNRTALGIVMRPVIIIMAAIGVYKLVKSAINYFDVRAERKRIEKVNNGVMQNADAMTRMAHAREMETQAEMIESQLPQKSAEPESFHFRNKFPPQPEVKDFRTQVSPTQAKDFREKIEAADPSLQFAGRVN